MSAKPQYFGKLFELAHERRPSGATITIPYRPLETFQCAARSMGTRNRSFFIEKLESKLPIFGFVL